MQQPQNPLSLSLLCIALAAAPAVFAQTAQTAAGQTTEVATKETAITFKSGVNLVPVPVVVRDSKGHAVGNLTIDDFQLFDNGKPQMISKFTLEKLVKDIPATATATATAPKPDTPAAGALADVSPDGIPDRFVAYLFDDLHLKPAELVYAREAAVRQVDSALHALDRAAVYTTSGQQMSEFTGDKDKLHKYLAAIGASNAAASKAMEQTMCPPVSYYMGDMIYNKHDARALDIATADAMVCAHLEPAQIELARSMAQNSARTAVDLGDRDTLSALDTLRAVIGKMASMPGQRSIVLVSPGFLVLDDRLEEETRMIERAIKANVVIGALDARGLYTQILGGDASEHVVNPNTTVAKNNYVTMESIVRADIMANLASGTGGTFYHGLNDMDEGLALTAAAPDYLYVLGFNPLDLKLDGKFHNLKVTLKSNIKGASLQVRKGYYAPKYAADPDEQAKQQIEEAFFSRDEVHDLPAVLQTQYFKTDDGEATLSAVAKIDAKKLAYHKEADRNRNDVTVVTGLFDNDGNYVSGVQKIVTMRLLDETIEKRLGSGISIKSSFTVHPGRYVVRMVVRDTEGQLMSAQSSLVEIP
jgi:VWFA-related protein